MVDNGKDAAMRILLSMESSESSIEELHSIHSISSLSEGSLELPSQTGSVRLFPKSKYAASQQRIRTTALDVDAADQDDDAISLNSSHFTLGLNPSERLDGEHQIGRSLHDGGSFESSEGRESTEERSTTVSINSSDHEDSCSDQLEIAALLAKAKSGINQVHEMQQAIGNIQSMGIIQTSGPHAGKSQLESTRPTEAIVDSPSAPDKSSSVEELEAEETELSAPATMQKQSIESICRENQIKLASSIHLDCGETDGKQSESPRPAQRLSHYAMVSEPSNPRRTSVEKEKLHLGGKRDSHRKGTQSTVQKRDHVQDRALVTKGEMEQEDSQIKGESPTPAQRLSQYALISEPSNPRKESFQREKLLLEGKREDRQSCESQRDSNQSSLQERDGQDRGLATQREKEQEDSQVKGRYRQSYQSHRKSNPTISHVEKDDDLAQTSGRKSKTIQTDRSMTLCSGNQKQSAQKVGKQKVDCGAKGRDTILIMKGQSKKAQKTTTDRLSWEGYQDSQTRNEGKDEFMRRSLAYEKTDERFESKRKTVLREVKSKEMQVEAKDRHFIQNEELSAPQAVKKKINGTPLKEEKKEVVPQNKEKTQETERQGKDDSTWCIPKVDCRPISEKLKESLRSRRQYNAGPRMSYHSPQFASRLESKRDSVTSYQRDYKLESREDSFGGERTLHGEQNRLTEISSPTFRCRALSDKERLMKIYQEKEKLANEFIANWSKLSGMTTENSYMRQNDQYAFESQINYNYKQRLPIRNIEVSPWSRISSLTHEFPHYSTMAWQAKAHPSHRQRQVGSKKKRWVCDICGVVNFESYAACFIHEKNCTGPVRDAIIENPTRGRAWLLSE